MNKLLSNFAFLIILFIGLKAHSEDRIYVASGNQGTYGIRVFDTSGIQLYTITNPLLNFPTVLAGYNNGNNLITDINFVGNNGPDLVKLDLNGNILARTSNFDIFGQTGGGITSVINSGHDTFFTIGGNDQIAELDGNLSLIRRFTSNVPDTGGLHLIGGAVNNNGSKLFIADMNGQTGQGLVRVYDTASGQQTGTLGGYAFLDAPRYIAFDSYNNLYVSNLSSDPTKNYPNYQNLDFIVFDQTLSFLKKVNSGLPSNYYPQGQFDIDSNNNIFTIESYSSSFTTVKKIDTNGNFISEFGSELSGNAIISMPAPVTPIPATSWLLLSGVGGLGLMSRKRKTLGA